MRIPSWLKPNTLWRKVAWLGGLLLVFFKPIYFAIGFISNLETAIKLGGNSYVIALYEFITSPIGYTIVLLLGVLWLSGLVWYQAKYVVTDEPPPEVPFFPVSMRFQDAWQFVRESNGKRIFHVGVANVPMGSGLKLQLSVSENPEWYWPVPHVNLEGQGDGKISEYGSNLALTAIVAQELDSKEISFLVPCHFTRMNGGVPKSLWCRLSATNEPTQPALRGMMTFWLVPNEEGELQMKVVSGS